MLVVKSPEDTVLRKLLWYRAGGGVSDRQWRDVLEVLRVSGDGLDRGYLGDWADRLGITALLTRAVSESSAPSGRYGVLCSSPKESWNSPSQAPTPSSTP
jgi:hypothetical protein